MTRSKALTTPVFSFRRPDDTADVCTTELNIDPESRQLWAALRTARVESAPRTLAAAEEAVFRFYVPLAKSLSDGVAKRTKDPDGAEQAAELGLAQAVLGWSNSSAAGFEGFARHLITDRLRQFLGVAGPPHSVSLSAMPAPPHGLGEQAAPVGMAMEER